MTITLDDELVERAARGICLSYGEDPDDFVAPNVMCGPNNEKLPMWSVFEEQARAAITAYLQGSVDAGKAKTGAGFQYPSGMIGANETDDNYRPHNTFPVLILRLPSQNASSAESSATADGNS
jgi:hypothetical protein